VIARLLYHQFYPFPRQNAVAAKGCSIWRMRSRRLTAILKWRRRRHGGSEEADVWPLLGEELSGNKLAAWLAERIYEVEGEIGRLPSIAVFVDGDAQIDPLVEPCRNILTDKSILIVGCKEGRVVGDAREVRVFDIQHKHIKGP
jgi:hypothetical protein